MNPRHPDLSARQEQVLLLLGDGLDLFELAAERRTDREVAAATGLPLSTVHRHGALPVVLRVG